MQNLLCYMIRKILLYEFSTTQYTLTVQVNIQHVLLFTVLSVEKKNCLPQQTHV